jgi:hypothetical protein
MMCSVNKSPKCKYDEPYIKFEFISTDPDELKSLCVFCSAVLVNACMELSRSDVTSENQAQ